MSFCSKCGQPLADGARFCGSCGAPAPGLSEAGAPTVIEPSVSKPSVSKPVSVSPETEPAEAVTPEAGQSTPPSQPEAPQTSEYQQPQDAWQRPQSDYQTPYQQQNGYQQDSYYRPQSDYQQPGNGAAVGVREKKGSKLGLIIGISVGAVIIIAALCYLLFFSGKNYSGYWECSGIDLLDGAGKVDDIYDMDVDELFALMLNKDKTFLLYVSGEDMVSGDWSSSGKSVTLTAEGEDVKLSYKNGELVMDLSDDSDGIIIYFEYESKNSPDGFGVTASATPEPTEEPDTTAAPETDAPETGAPSSGGVTAELGENAAREFDSFTVEILGGEPAEDDYEDNCFRVYYSFTNTSDAPVAPYWSDMYITAMQNGEELDTTYLISDVEADDYSSFEIMPGVTILCAEVFQLEDSSTVEVYFCDDWDLDKENSASASFDPTADTADFTYEFRTVSNPTWTDDMSQSATWETIECSIDGAEITDSWSGSDDLIRVSFTFTNNSDSAMSFTSDVSVYVFQDDVELPTGYADETTVSDDMFYSNIEPGKTQSVSECYALRSSSPVVVLVYDWNSGEYIGYTYKLG